MWAAMDERKIRKEKMYKLAFQTYAVTLRVFLSAMLLLLAERPSNVLSFSMDGFAQAIVRTDTLRKKLQISLAISLDHSILTPVHIYVCITVSL